jgi:hypothetical protein
LRIIASRLRHLDSVLASNEHPISFVLDQLLDSPWSSITLTRGHLDLEKKCWSLQFGIIFHPVAPDLVAELRRVSRVVAPFAGRDLSAYKPAGSFIDSTHPTYKHVRRALAKNPWIKTVRPMSRKTGKPVRNRLLIHAGDWKDYLLEESKHASADPMDLPAETVLDVVQELEGRKARVRAGRVAME